MKKLTLMRKAIKKNEGLSPNEHPKQDGVKWVEKLSYTSLTLLLHFEGFPHTRKRKVRTLALVLKF